MEAQESLDFTGGDPLKLNQFRSSAAMSPAEMMEFSGDGPMQHNLSPRAPPTPSSTVSARVSEIEQRSMLSPPGSPTRRTFDAGRQTTGGNPQPPSSERYRTDDGAGMQPAEALDFSGGNPQPPSGRRYRTDDNAGMKPAEALDFSGGNPQSPSGRRYKTDDGAGMQLVKPLDFTGLEPFNSRPSSMSPDPADDFGGIETVNMHVPDHIKRQQSPRDYPPCHSPRGGADSPPELHRSPRSKGNTKHTQTEEAEKDTTNEDLKAITDEAEGLKLLNGAFAKDNEQKSEQLQEQQEKLQDMTQQIDALTEDLAQVRGKLASSELHGTKLEQEVYALRENNLELKDDLHKARRGQHESEELEFKIRQLDKLKAKLLVQSKEVAVWLQPVCVLPLSAYVISNQLCGTFTQMSVICYIILLCAACLLLPACCCLFVCMTSLSLAS